MKQKIILIFLILWTAFIFYNSLKSAPDSLDQSAVVVEIAEEIIVRAYKGAPPADVREYIDNDLETDLRDFAHIFEFMVLYAIAYLFFNKKSNCSYKILSYALYYSTAVAVIDENLQLLMPGRGFQITDIIKDVMGCFIVIAIILTVNAIRNKKCSVQK